MYTYLDRKIADVIGCRYLCTGIVYFIAGNNKMMLKVKLVQTKKC
jgi:hypothetical protein